MGLTLKAQSLLVNLGLVTTSTLNLSTRLATTSKEWFICEIFTLTHLSKDSLLTTYSQRLRFLNKMMALTQSAVNLQRTQHAVISSQLPNLAILITGCTWACALVLTVLRAHNSCNDAYLIINSWTDLSSSLYIQTQVRKHSNLSYSPNQPFSWNT